MSEPSDFPPVVRPDGWSTVEVRDEAGKPAARFWVAAPAGEVALRAAESGMVQIPGSTTPALKAAPRHTANLRRTND